MADLLFIKQVQLFFIRKMHKIGLGSHKFFCSHFLVLIQLSLATEKTSPGRMGWFTMGWFTHEFLVTRCCKTQWIVNIIVVLFFDLQLNCVYSNTPLAPPPPPRFCVTLYLRDFLYNTTLSSLLPLFPLVSSGYTTTNNHGKLSR